MPVVNLPSESVQIPETFSVAVVMRQDPSNTPWADHHWEAVGVTVAPENVAETGVTKLRETDAGSQLYLYSSYHIRLHRDECESYYHNLVSPRPRCFVVAELNESGCPVPSLISLSFDEANAYLEGESQVYSVALPPELYRWCEDFVLAHYVPEKKIKRKRVDWKRQDTRNAAP